MTNLKRKHEFTKRKHDLFMEFSKRLSYLIENQFLGDRKKFQSATGIPYTTVHEYLKGIKKNPPMELLNKIIDAIPNVNAIWLLKGIGNPYLNEFWVSKLYETKYDTEPQILLLDTRENYDIVMEQQFEYKTQLEHDLDKLEMLVKEIRSQIKEKNNYKQ